MVLLAGKTVVSMLSHLIEVGLGAIFVHSQEPLNQGLLPIDLRDRLTPLESP
jgi:hypothetical protein